MSEAIDQLRLQPILVHYCVDCYWKDHVHPYCQHPLISFISGSPADYTKGLFHRCEDVRDREELTCVGFAPFPSLLARFIYRLFGIRIGPEPLIQIQGQKERTSTALEEQIDKAKRIGAAEELERIAKTFDGLSHAFNKDRMWAESESYAAAGRLCLAHSAELRRGEEK